MMEKITLKLIVQLLCYILECDAYQIRGIVDTSNKIIACYVADKACGIPQWEIAEYFQIDLKYMRNQLENMAIELLIHPEDEKEINSMIRLIKNITKIKISRT